MATTIKLKNSVTTTNAPSSLAQGEVAINITDKKVWVGNAATTPIQLLGAGSSGTFGALTCTSLTDSGLTSGRVTYATTGGLLTDASNFTFDGTTLTVPSASHSGNLTFTGTGNRITGDFSNATVANRVFFQTSTTNGNTNAGFLPNGTATQTIIRAYNNSDPTNASVVDLVVSSTDGRIQSAITGTGTYLPMTFFTGGSERMRIDTSGNVGIGTTSVTNGYKAQINGNLILGTTANPFITGTTSLSLYGDNSSSSGMTINTAGNVLIGTTTACTYLTVVNPTGLPTSTSANAAAVFKGNAGVGNGGAIGFDYNSTATYYPVGIGYNITDNAGYTKGDLVFSTRNATTDSVVSERMRITSAGDVLVGMTSYGNTVGVGFKPTGNAKFVLSASTNADDTLNVYSTGAGAFRFYVQMDGKINATSTTIAAISDQRLKENIQDIDVGLDALMALKPRKFDWKEGKGKNIKGDRGWIAQEFEQVFPEMIGIWKDEPPEGEEPYKSVAADLIPVLVKAIQEQQAQIEALTNRIKDLESK